MEGDTPAIVRERFIQNMLRRNQDLTNYLLKVERDFATGAPQTETDLDIIRMNVDNLTRAVLEPAKVMAKSELARG